MSAPGIRVGSSFEEGREIASHREIGEGVVLERARKSGVVLAEERLRWLKGLSIRRCELKVLADFLVPFIRAAVRGRLHGPELDHILPLLRRIDRAIALT